MLRETSYDVLTAAVDDRRRRLRSKVQEMEHHRDRLRRLDAEVDLLAIEIAELELAQDAIVQDLMGVR